MPTDKSRTLPPNLEASQPNSFGCHLTALTYNLRGHMVARTTSSAESWHFLIFSDTKFWLLYTLLCLSLAKYSPSVVRLLHTVLYLSLVWLSRTIFCLSLV